MSVRRPIPILPALLAPVLAVVVAVAIGPSPAAAGAPAFQIVADTTYEVRPADRLVHVTVDGRGTSYTANSATQIFYYDTAAVAILGGATSIRASANGSAAAVAVRESTPSQIVLEVALNRRVYYRQTGTFHLEFDLPTGAADGDVRVGANVAAFPVWAVGTGATPGSRVTISVPPDFLLTAEGEDVPSPSARPDGGLLYRWGPLADPVAFHPFVIADLAVIREDTFTEIGSVAILDGEEIPIEVLAWADDTAWGERVSAAITASLPVLADLIGLPYEGERPLRAQETVPRNIGGYAGEYRTQDLEVQILVSYDAENGVVIHETAHAWFHYQFAVDRWVVEGFASYYADLAATTLGIDPGQIELTDETREAAFPLLDWRGAGLEDRLTEQYGYGASLAAARAIGERAGTEALAEVWARWDAHQPAYQPGHGGPPETWSFLPNDHRNLLDQLEEASGEPFRDLWETWIVRPGEVALLDERDAARAVLDDLVSAAGPWELPTEIRRRMSAWAFSGAEALMAEAGAVLDERDNLADHAAALDLAVADDAEIAFELGNIDGASDVIVEAEDTLDAIDDAMAADDGEDLVETIGLLGADPEADLAVAREAFEEGSLTDAQAAAAAAAATWRGAAEAGTTRIVTGSAGLIALVGAAGGAWYVMARRRTGREAKAPAEGSDGADGGASGGDQPDAPG